VGCFSTDGTTPLPVSKCLPKETCEDEPGWEDSTGHTCAMYRSAACEDFSLAPWLASDDDQNFTTDDVATDACCPCRESAAYLSANSPAKTNSCSDYEPLQDCLKLSALDVKVAMEAGGSAVEAKLMISNPTASAQTVKIKMLETKMAALRRDENGERRLGSQQALLPSSPSASDEEDALGDRMSQLFTDILGLTQQENVEREGDGSSRPADASDSSSIFAEDGAVADGWDEAGNSCGGRLIMRLKASAADGSHRRLREDKSLGVKSWQGLRNVNLDIAHIDCTQLGSMEEALEQVKDKYGEALELVEVDQKVRLFGNNNAATSDPFSMLQWGMNRIRVSDAWKRVYGPSSTRKEVIVAVVDTGVEVNHPELASRMWVNPGEVPGNGIDDDNNGFVDDVHGWSILLEEGIKGDLHGHGTHCAGVIAASANNSVGVAGISSSSQIADVKIMAVGAFNEHGGGKLSDAIAGLNYALAQGATLSSHSWGMPSSSKAFEAAAQTALEAGHFIVAAAGNDGEDHEIIHQYPCDLNYDNVVCVGSVGPSFGGAYKQSRFSDFNSRYVDIAAPGERIFSTYLNGGYKYMDGTSMATPHVTGSIALVMSNFPHLTVPQVKQLLFDSASFKEETKDWVANGVLDTDAFVALAGGVKVGWVNYYMGEKNPKEVSSTELKSQTLAVDRYSSVFASDEAKTISLLVGGEDMRPGRYTTSLNISWEGKRPDYSLVDVNLEVTSGTDGIFAEVKNTGFPWKADGLSGITTVGSEGISHSAVLGNLGSEPMQISIEGLSEDENWTFQLSTKKLYDGNPGKLFKGEKMSLPSGEKLEIEVQCVPFSPGTSTKELVIRTNLNMQAEASRAPDAVNKGTVFTLPYTCVGEPLPELAVTTPATSGVSASAGGVAIPISRSVPADWNNYWTETTASSTLALVNGSGCSSASLLGVNVTGKVAFLEESNDCDVDEQARTLAEAGAIGHITTSEALPATPLLYNISYAAPSIPTFAVHRSAGRWFKRRLLMGEQVDVTLTWNPPLDGVPSETKSISFLVKNEGTSTFNYSVDISPAFEGFGLADFYEMSSPPTALTDQKDLMELSALRSEDDACTSVQLPFAFPVFSDSFQNLTISTNGLASYGEAGCAGFNEENATKMGRVIAPADADLICFSDSRIAAGSIDNGETFVVQWKDMGFYGLDEKHRLSFEIRLYKDGNIGFAYSDFTGAVSAGSFSAFWSSARVLSLITADKVQGGLQSHSELHYARWPVVVDHSRGAVVPGESRLVTVTATAGLVMQGMVSIEAKYASGTGGLTKTFPLTWPADDFCEYSVSEWSECSPMTPCAATGPAEGTKRREVSCLKLDMDDANNNKANKEAQRCPSTKFCKSNWATTRSFPAPATNGTCHTVCTTTVAESIVAVATSAAEVIPTDTPNDEAGQDFATGTGVEAGEDVMTTSTATTTGAIVLSEVVSRDVFQSRLVFTGEDDFPKKASVYSESCRTALASIFNVSQSRIDILRWGTTGSARLLTGSLRRLASTYFVEFMVVLDSDPNQEHIVFDTAGLEAAVISALQEAGVDTTKVSIDSEELLVGSEKQVAWIRGRAGVCAASEKVECGQQFVGTMERQAVCAELINGTWATVDEDGKASENALCSGLTVRQATETCTGVGPECPLEDAQESSSAAPSTRKLRSRGIATLLGSLAMATTMLAHLFLL